jgi:hypothetical protein
MSNDLVATTPSVDEQSAKRDSRRPNAEFLAHLVATAVQAPQTRVRRRAEPKEATAAYDALDHSPIPSGRSLSRSL